MARKEFARLSPVHFGLAIGIIWSAGIFIWSAFFTKINWCASWLPLMQNCYIGLDSSILGSLIGAVWGFFDGFIGGFIIAWLYNKLLK